jgi:hypothetical protein
MSNFKQTDSFLRGNMKLEYKEPKIWVPVILTLETKEEYEIFWDGIEEVCQLMRDNDIGLENLFYLQLVKISNMFSELN